ncbi:MAG: hypothetical protein IKA17_03810 [Clostridia bacterium]|nr:hypothetical protein [Clostridia bacterium]
MPLSEARKRANAKYNQKAYDRIEVKVKKGRKEEIREFAESQGESINAFINRAIAEAMGEAERKQAVKQRRRSDISVELL